jgi:hypothetical protein
MRCSQRSSRRAPAATQSAKSSTDRSAICTPGVGDLQTKQRSQADAAQVYEGLILIANDKPSHAQCTAPKAAAAAPLQPHSQPRAAQIARRYANPGSAICTPSNVVRQMQHRCMKV